MNLWNDNSHYLLRDDHVMSICVYSGIEMFLLCMFPEMAEILVWYMRQQFTEAATLLVTTSKRFLHKTTTEIVFYINNPHYLFSQYNAINSKYSLFYRKRFIQHSSDQLAEPLSNHSLKYTAHTLYFVCKI